MPIYYTYDERSTGPYYSSDATNYYDAPSVPWSSSQFQIAEGFYNPAYGVLASSWQNYYSNDVDYYNMGVLDAGTYSVYVSRSSWLNVSNNLSPLYVTVEGSSYNYMGGWSDNLTFTLNRPEEYYIKISGGNIYNSATPYQVYYTYQAPINYGAIGNVIIDGLLIDGGRLQVSGSILDFNGSTIAYVEGYSYVWYTSSDNVNWTPVGVGSDYLIGSQDLGKYIDVVIQFNDDDNFLETVSPDAVFIPIPDTIAPTIGLSASDTNLTVGETSVITFTLSEASTDFVVDDVTVTGGTLSGFSGSGTSYTATFTPTAESTTNGVVSVASNRFTDAASNLNTDGSDSNNRVTMSVNTVPPDTIAPTIGLSASDTNLTVGETSVITFTLSETSTDFGVDDVAVTGGTLSGFSGSGTSYTATFTPTADSTTNGVVSVASNRFTDAASNLNTDGSDSNNRVTMSVNTVPPDTIAPTIGLSASDTNLTVGETSVITFTLSEASINFGVDDVAVTGGTLSGFSGSGTSYTAIFSPTTDSATNGVVSVASNRFTDAASNLNTDGSDANNNLSIIIDTRSSQLAVTVTQRVTNENNHSLFKLSNGFHSIGDSSLSVGDAAPAALYLKTVAGKAFKFKTTPSAVLTYGDETFGVISGSGKAWTEQKFGADGLAQGSAIKMTLSDLLAKESLFDQDINGGGIGDTISQIFDTGPDEEDAYGLYKTASGSMVIDTRNLGLEDSTDSPIYLKVGAKAYAPKSAPAALLDYGDGSFGVIAGAGRAWTEQKFDDNGLAQGSLIKLSLSDLFAKEKFFNKDINGEGVGDTIGQIFDNDSGDGYGLYKTTSGLVVIDSEGLSLTQATDSPITLKIGTKEYAPKIAPASLLDYGDGSFGVIAGSDKTWTEQKFNANGVASGKAIKLSLSDLLIKETTFNEDINGGGVGDVITQLMDANGYLGDAPYGLYKTDSAAYVLDGLNKNLGERPSEDSIRVLSGLKNWSPKGEILGIAEKGSGFIEVLLKDGQSYKTQKIDPTSGLLSGPAAKLANETQLLAREHHYNLDLNGDDTIDIIGQSVPPDNWFA